MAASTFDIERRAEDGQNLRNLQLQVITLEHRVDRQEARLNQIAVVAYLAAGGGLMFGLVNFVLLMQLLGRL
jgi:hypothetical protein